MPSHCSRRMEQSQHCPTKQTSNSVTSFCCGGFGYSSEQGRAMAWTSASHSSAKAHSHWPVACLRRVSLEYEFVQVLSPWLYSYAEQNYFISQTMLAGTSGMHSFRGRFPGSQNVIKSSLVVVFPCLIIFFNCFSQIYMSPEVILCRGHTTKADIYSMGATIIHMQTGIPPWVNRYPRSAYPSYLYIVSVLSRASSVSVGGFPLLLLGIVQSYKNYQNICQRDDIILFASGEGGREEVGFDDLGEDRDWAGVVSVICVSIYRLWAYWKDRVRSVRDLIETSPFVFYLSVFLRNCR